ncbi:MAG TPA: glycosyltransferase, partial [Actinoplanes sp.]|nr:glycosyltransferase [Actinoplanes sp.]
MRICFVAAPMQGHLLPLIPLAMACRDAGHEVTLASGGLPGGAGGLPLHDIGANFNLQRSALRVTLRHPRAMVTEMTGRSGSAMVGELFGRASLDLLGPLIRLAARNRPDLIVYDSLGQAGALLAGRIGVPTVLHESTLWPADDLFRAVSRSTALRKHTVPAPDLTITTAPPSLVGRHPGRPMRPVPYAGEGEVPEWLLAPADRPRILVSRSTVRGPNDGDPSTAVVASASAVDAEIVLVRPPESVTRKALPGNVRVVGRVPLHRVMPHAAGYVHHGGAGSVLNGLSAGVPQLVVPGAGDRRHNAGLVARRGAGLAGAPSRATITRRLADGGLRAAAAEVRAEVGEQPRDR